MNIVDISFFISEVILKTVVTLNYAICTDLSNEQSCQFSNNALYFPNLIIENSFYIQSYCLEKSQRPGI